MMIPSFIKIFEICRQNWKLAAKNHEASKAPQQQQPRWVITRILTNLLLGLERLCFATLSTTHFFEL